MGSRIVLYSVLLLEIAVGPVPQPANGGSNGPPHALCREKVLH